MEDVIERVVDLELKGNFTDAVVRELVNLKLESLELSSPKLTAQSLIELRSSKTLRYLMLDQYIFAPEDIEALNEALPDCQIYVDFWRVEKGARSR